MCYSSVPYSTVTYVYLLLLLIHVGLALMKELLGE